jgi:hypothetical protein
MSLRRLLAVSPLLLLVSLAAPAAALADSVVGATSFTDRFGWTHTATIDAHAGAFGEDASGSMTWTSIDTTGAVRSRKEGQVTCLNVDGGRAIVIGTYTYSSEPLHPNQGFKLSFQDNPDGPDQMSLLSVPFLEDTSWQCVLPLPLQPVTAGDVSVLDEASTAADAIAYLDSLVTGLDLPPGNIHTLRNALAGASTALGAVDPAAACDELDRFTRDLANNPDTKLSPADRERFIGYASHVRAKVGC